METIVNNNNPSIGQNIVKEIMVVLGPFHINKTQSPSKTSSFNLYFNNGSFNLFTKFSQRKQSSKQNGLAVSQKLSKLSTY